MIPVQTLCNRTYPRLLFHCLSWHFCTCQDLQMRKRLFPDQKKHNSVTRELTRYHCNPISLLFKSMLQCLPCWWDSRDTPGCWRQWQRQAWVSVCVLLVMGLKSQVLRNALALGNKCILVHCWWECKTVYLLWKIVWRFLKKLKIEFLYDPEIPLLVIYPMEVKEQSQRDICTPVFTEALFTTTKKEKQPNVHQWQK